MAPVLELKDLRVEFPTRRGTLVAVDDVSLEIGAGEVLGVVGESGAGKSMTGAAVIGLLEPPGRIAGGEILLDGERIDNPALRAHAAPPRPADRDDLPGPADQPQPALHDRRQLVETIRTHLDLSAGAARERALRLLAEVGIPAPGQRFDHYPHQFSGGMRQRVVIALALCAEPRLVIADEPTTALDVSIQAQIIALLKRLCDEHGTAVMLITHDMGVIAETADRVAVMYAGRIVEIGPVREVIGTPRHPYTQGLMGSIPVIGRTATGWSRSRAHAAADGDPAGLRVPSALPAAFERCRRERPELMPVAGGGRRLLAARRSGAQAAPAPPIDAADGRWCGSRG